MRKITTSEQISNTSLKKKISLLWKYHNLKRRIKVMLRKIYVPVRNLRRKMHKWDTKLLLSVASAKLVDWSLLLLFESFFTLQQNDPHFYFIIKVSHSILVVGEFFAVIFLLVSLIHKLLSIWNKTE